MALVAGKIVDICGHAKLMFIGALLMTISIIVFSGAKSLSQDWEVIALGIFLRLC